VPISGRYPKYSNEIMITPQIRDAFHANLGDRLEIKDGDAVKDYIVVGLISAASDMGQCIFRALDSSDADLLGSGKVIVLKDRGELQDTIDAIGNAYGNTVFLINMRNAIKNVTEGIQLGVLSVTALMIVVAVALILLTTVLVARLAVIREQIDMSVLHAAGYSKKQLRGQFVLRFALVSLTGCLLGLILELAFSDKMMSAILGLAGISRFVGDKGVIVLFVPIILIAGATALFSWISTGKINRISVRNLNHE
jgi:ABC-type antimicrobial peptide transport system permease subunit